MSLVAGLVMLAAAFAAHKAANSYISAMAGPTVPDLLLAWLPTVPVDYIIILGPLLFTVFSLALFIYQPRYLNFGLKALAIFVAVRSFSIILTHLGPAPGQMTLDASTPGFYWYSLLFTTTNDFFFSGHTGVPFLLALAVWPAKFWRYVSLLTSVVFGVGMLLAHLHYSIDVLAAPFMAYSLFALCRRIFPRDYALSRQG